MELGLTGKVAAVAAASRGLGRAVAEALAREGANVAICARNRERVEKAAEEIARATGREVLPVVADVATPEGPAAFVEATVAQFGRLHILFSNAGGPAPGRFDEISEEDWLKGVDLTLLSAIRLTRAALPHIRRQGWGRLIYLTSVSVKQPIDTLVASNVLRPGVVGLAKSLATQLAAEGITVNVVCPGYFRTERVEELAQDLAKRRGISPEEVIAEWEAGIPARRLGNPAELGDFVAFLASERAAYLTGATIQVDGGYVRALM
ncbi:MAG: SDR family oxidoreductase [Calditrichaeota bacterium]|nr:SDR family oxidoreductase [Calditrichota bacterium]